jgi:RimJ/RimL family protein N-acetyltransferase
LARPLDADRSPRDVALVIRIELRDLVDEDIPIFFANHRDPEAARMAAFGTKDQDASALAARWRKYRADGSMTHKTIVVDGEVAGSIATFPLEGKAQVTYWIGRSHWGRGIATEALSRFLELVTTRPLYASAAKDNVGSLRVLQKCGFVVVGSERAFASARGEEIDEVFLELRD